jgi:hypothetical protein
VPPYGPKFSINQGSPAMMTVQILPAIQSEILYSGGLFLIHYSIINIIIILGHFLTAILKPEAFYKEITDRILG